MRLRAERAYLPRRISALERGEVHHPDRKVERVELRIALDRALRELRGSRLERDGVDSADPGQPTAARQLERTRKCQRLAHGVSLECARRAAPRRRQGGLIRRPPLFELCSKRDLRRIAALADERTVDSGTELIREGEPGDEFFVVVDGEVEVQRHGRRIARLTEGSYVGEIALLSRSPRTATVVAVTPLRVLAIAGRDFVELLDGLPELWLKVARTLADRVEADEAMDASHA